MSCHLDLHVLGRRVSHAVPLNPWTATADFGLDVLGPGIRDWHAVDLAAVEVRLSLDGHEHARGRGDTIPRGPLAPVAKLAGDLARRGPGLNVGDLVSTGSPCGLVRPVPGRSSEPSSDLLEPRR